MPRQFTLWPTQKPTAEPRIWADLDEPQRTKLITKLARLISDATRPQDRGPKKENDHGR